MKRKWILGLIVILVVFSMSCALTNLIKGVEEIDDQAQQVVEEISPEEEAAGATDEEAAEATGDEADDEAGQPGDFDPQGYDKLNSYRMTVEFRSENADGSIETQTIEIAHTREPHAEHTMMKGVTEDGQAGDIETIQIEKQQWMRFNDMWVYSEIPEEDELIGESLNVDEMNEEALAEAKDLGIETVNGIRCRHYEIDDAMAFFGDEAMVGEVEEAHGDIWIAEESGLPAFMVRYEVDAIGKATEENPVEKFFVVMNVTDVNTDIVIEPPEEAQAETGTEAGSESSGPVGDVPVMENAQNKTVMGDIIVYETESDFQTVADFYAAEMVAAGWTKEATIMEMENVLMESWTKEGQSLQLSIAADEDSGNVAVTIMKEPSE